MLNIYERTEKERIDLEKTIEKILSYAKKQGADQAKVSINKNTGISADIRAQSVEKVTFSKDRSLGITVFCNHCSGSVATTDLSDSAIYDAVDAAIAISKHTERDEFSGLADKDDLYFDHIDLDRFHPKEPDPDLCIQRAMELERLTMGKPMIKQTISSYTSSSYGQAVFGNSYGQIISIPFSSFCSSLTLLGEKDGNMETGGGYHISCDSDNLWSTEKIADEAISDTVSKLGARKVSTTTSPVIFDNTVAPSVFSILCSAISGNMQYKKISFINDCLGQQIFPSWINVYEDPLIKKSLYSRSFDHDGVKTKPKHIIENGIVKTYILSAYTARQLKMKNTGNAGGTCTLKISNSGISQEALFNEMGTGLLVKETMGMDIDPTTGDFSFGAEGQWIENGQIVYPVHEITIAGNIKDVFKNIVKIANDIDPRFKNKVGSILLGPLKIAGK